jgi:hypothetical protein
MTADIIDLERRVSALEKAQKETAETQTWMASTLGRIAAVQDDHTQRLENIENRLGKVEFLASGASGTIRASPRPSLYRRRGYA